MSVATFNRFHDEPGSPFYQANGKSPEQTWKEIVDGLGVALSELRERRSAGRFAIEPVRIAEWHNVVFGSTFPDDAGRFRGKLPSGDWEHVSFGIHVGTAKTAAFRPMRGSHPNRIQENLDRACRQYDQVLQELLAGTSVSPVRDAAHGAVRLYAKVCSIHPFVDGNLRAAFVTLQAALLNLDLPAIEFPDPEEHNVCLDQALRIDGRQTYEPLAALAEHLIKLQG